MFLSHLMIDVGSTPDRPRPGRLWLRDIYRVHQRLSMAFPTPQQRALDPQFLCPFDPMGFEPRSTRTHFLFRVDNNIEDASPRAIILVQSDLRPDWGYAFHNARMFLAAESETRQYDPALPAGTELRFRIRVNLSKKSPQYRLTREGPDSNGHARTQGKRVALTWDKGQRPDDVIREWFAHKTAGKGFEVRHCEVMHLSWVSGYKPNSEGPHERHMHGENPARRMRFRSALLEGRLTVIDAAAFAHAVASGIGSAKAFGFGLLSVAPVR